jgi:hypothetical protein
MASTGQKGPFSDKASTQHTVVLPAERDSTSNDASGSHPGNNGEQTKPWKPSFNRQQSWNEQDMKREMQTRLLQTVKGTESGFSENKPS